MHGNTTHLGSMRSVSPDDVILMSQGYQYNDPHLSRAEIKYYRVFYIECFDGAREYTRALNFSDLFSQGWDFAYSGIFEEVVIIK